MSLLQRNILANLAGNGWSALIAIVVIPFYIRFMGIEVYGLIGIYTTLLSLSFILDLGISTTVSREMARLKSLPENVPLIRNLARTLEILSWGIALILGLLVFVLASPITHYWIRPVTLDYLTIHRAIILMGVSLIFQWPFSFYSSGLIGLERQVLLNTVTSIIMTVRCSGAVVVLWWVSPTVEAFFIWQILTNVIQSVVMMICLWRVLPASGKKLAFRIHLIRDIWRFAAGMGGITITGLIWSQIDKLILSRLLSLEMFGYYTLAWVVATSLSRVMGPIVMAIFPRLTHLVTVGDIDGVKHVYHGGCQLMSVLTAPVALFIAFFASELLFLWTRSATVADKAHLLVIFLTLSTLFNGMSHVPLSLEYAHGRTRLVFFTGIGTILVLIPTLFLATIWFGAAGATISLATINLAYSVVMTRLIHKHLLPKEYRTWCFTDIGLPIAASLSVVVVGRVLLQGITANWSLIIGMLAVIFGAVSVAALSAPFVRIRFYVYFTNLQRRFSYGS
jgi:O-antigen/teichoic acid export membrane protein